MLQVSVLVINIWTFIILFIIIIVNLIFFQLKDTKLILTNIDSFLYLYYLTSYYVFQ